VLPTFKNEISHWALWAHLQSQRRQRVEDCKFEVSWNKVSMRPYLKNRTQTKELRAWFKCYSARLASARPWVQSPVLKNIKKKKKE
jgi:hypothetical protein